MPDKPLRKRTDAAPADKPLRKRTDAAPAARPSAEEWTVPLPLGSLEKCPACDEPVDPAKLTRRPDGQAECGSCGAPIGAPDRVERRTEPEPIAAPPADPFARANGKPAEERPPKATEPLPRVYCDQCGAEWPRVNERPAPNCGHTEGFVHDPRKAKSYNPPAGHAFDPTIPRTPPARARADDPPPTSGTQEIDPLGGAPAVVVRRRGDVYNVVWGKANFMVLDHSSMTIGEFSVIAERPEGVPPEEFEDALLARLEALADRAFDRQFAWYKKQLGIIEKPARR